MAAGALPSSTVTLQARAPISHGQRQTPFETHRQTAASAFDCLESSLHSHR